MIDLSKFDQIVVYGANGWLGRTAVDLVADFDPEKLLLLGSRSSSLLVTGKNYEILESRSSLHQISDNALFLNFAFLRREKMSELGPARFNVLNTSISEFAHLVISSGKVSCLINASSGVAKLVEDGTSTDLYAQLKYKAENEFREITKSTDSNFINCRIFSILGEYLNEFKNLAVSDFILQAKNSEMIHVQSPNALRSFVSAKDLVSIMLKLSISDQDHEFESGGDLTSMLNFAQLIASKFNACEVKFESEASDSPDYVGNIMLFHELAQRLKVPLKNLSEQIDETLLAF